MNYDIQSLLGDNKKNLQGLSETIIKNIQACKELSAMIKTSMGPNGLNKAIINHLGKLTITSKTATVISELEVMHPAAKLLVIAATAQQREIGDGTNQVITIAGELLSRAEHLIRDGLHPTDIVNGYRKAADKAIEVLTSLVCPGSEVFDNKNEIDVIQRIKGTVTSKHFGNDEFLCQLVARACIYVCPLNSNNFKVENVRISKIAGGSFNDSLVVKGLIMIRDTEGSVKSVTNAKVVVYSSGLGTTTTETKSNLLLRNPNDLLDYNKSEEMEMDKVIRSLVDSGVKVVVIGSSIKELTRHFLEKYGLMLIQILSKFELDRFCQATGSCAISKSRIPTAEELGFAEAITVKIIGITKCIVVEQGPKSVRFATIVIRATIQSVMADMEQALESGITAFKTLSMDSRTVPAGGSTEMQISMQLMDIAHREYGIEQYAIQKFAEALQIIPRTLAENSGLSVTGAISSMWSAHNMGKKTAGLNIKTGEAEDLSKKNLVDIYATKWWSLKLVCDAVYTLLQVDHIIMAKQPRGSNTEAEGE
eukprot:gnl/TRDRNA2_/TRDRNA2_175339_c0_seq1.p1 gnl/TRDRNA2_/TRDRNA2_175339_c0~~gnl/TRDRNA2_/TRDRNA2_175339_c0_seq1.p1  ORF type:complete len:536 (-),score=-14.96 gnl/TRDRNA2_/TRDRNA2_175339_c0_seq1:140-1747(-)